MLKKVFELSLACSMIWFLPTYLFRKIFPQFLLKLYSFKIYIGQSLLYIYLSRILNISSWNQKFYALDAWWQQAENYNLCLHHQLPFLCSPTKENYFTRCHLSKRGLNSKKSALYPQKLKSTFHFTRFFYKKKNVEFRLWGCLR